LAEYVHRLICEDLGIVSVAAGLRTVGVRGLRYSFGYPACPELEDQKKVFELIPASDIGVSLSETFQLIPEESTTAIVVHHPNAKYFSI